MALTTAGVAYAAMFVHRLFERNFGVRRAAFAPCTGQNGLVHGFKGVMKAFGSGCNDIFMALSADPVRGKKRGIFYYPFMRGLPIVIFRVPAVTFLTINFTVICFEKRRGNVYFLIQL